MHTAGFADKLRRYREPIIVVEDMVPYTEKEVPFLEMNQDGKLEEKQGCKLVEREYTLSPADPKKTADRWSYLDPENGHHPSTRATG